MVNQASKPASVKTTASLRADQVEPIEKIIIARGVPLKYLIFTISDGNSTGTILRCGATDPATHYDIATRIFLDRELTKFKIAANGGITPNGGGYIRYDSELNRIRVWGRSMQYGYPDVRQVRSMLRKAYGNDIKIEYSSYDSIYEDSVSDWKPIETMAAD